MLERNPSLGTHQPGDFWRTAVCVAVGNCGSSILREGRASMRQACRVPAPIISVVARSNAMCCASELSSTCGLVCFFGVNITFSLE